jgi:hypothetical protein
MEHIVDFPSDSVGTIYFRVGGRRRWVKLCPARARFYLGTGLEYRLVLRCMESGDAINRLKGVKVELFKEVSISFMVAETDYRDSMTGGSRWLDPLLEEWGSDVRSVLPAGTNVEFCVELIPVPE